MKHPGGTRLLLALLASCAPLMAGAPGQRARENAEGARISGRVFAADTGKPMRGAIVTLADTRGANASERRPRWVATNAEGWWELPDVAAGRYTLAAVKTGYLRLEYGQQRPFERGRILDVAAGQVLERLDVTLPRGSAITGRVFDESGDPVAAAVVRAMRLRYVDGRRQMTPLVEGLEGLGSGAGDVTDDLGQFRLYGLAPGDYYVSAVFSPPGDAAGAVGYPPTYHPGAATAMEAHRVRVGLGEEAQGINVMLAPARYAVVSGTVSNSQNAPVSASLSLVTSDPAGAPAGPARSDATGTFAFRNVPPGEYRLHVYGAQSPAGLPEFASIPLSVAGQDLTGLALVTAPGATASGRVVLEDAPRPQQRLFVRGVATSPDTPTFANTSVGVNPDLTFEMDGLIDRQTFRLGMLPDGWFLKSVTHDGADITDAGYPFKPGQRVSGIRILATRRATVLTGTVRGDRGSAADFSVVAFSTDSARWGFQTRFVRSARPDQAGRFTIRALPPGDYYVVALEYLETGQESDPEFLEMWRGAATSVRLAEGETKEVPLKLAR